MSPGSEPVEPAPALFVSPHLDDVVLSAGGTVHRLARLGHHVTVATVFAGDRPPGPLSPFARQLHQSWGLGDEPIGARRAEDRAAAAELGGERVTAVHLDFTDAVYRIDECGEPRYPDWPSTSSGRLHRLDGALVATVTTEVERLVETLTGHLAATPGRSLRVFGPLGAGGHVDHVIVRRALDGLGRPIERYEDLPYVARGGVGTASVAGLIPWLGTLDEEDLSAKLRAVAWYRSQIETVFAPDSPELLERHARFVGGTRPAERFWFGRGAST